MSMHGAGPQEAQTVAVHVQVIDVEPLSLDMTVPMYLPARDLTQRLARDAGLGAFWPDGTRRKFYLRARGRLLQDEDKLSDFGVVHGELLHLLPEPPPGSGVQERVNQRVTNTTPPSKTGLKVWSVLYLVGWSLLWGVALSTNPSGLAAALCGFGAAFVSVRASRLVLGGVAGRWLVPSVGLAFVLASGIASGVVGTLTSILVEGAAPVVASELWLSVALGIGSGIVGVSIAWAAWYGAAEPLPDISEAEDKAAQAMVTYPCAICAQPVRFDAGLATSLPCGHIFHTGCLNAKQAVYQGTGCPVCGVS